MAFQPPARQVAALTAENFLDTIRQLLGADNAARNEAEVRYEQAKRSEPVQLVASLVQVLSKHDLDVPVREQCAVLLRQCCGKVKESDSTWQKLGSHQAEVRSQLLQLLEAEPVQQVRRKVSDCIQSLGNQLVDIDDDQRPQNLQEWPELMPTLFRVICDTSKDIHLRADCLWIVKELTCSVWQMLLANPTQTFQVLQTCVLDHAVPVKAEATALLCSFVDSIPNKEGRKPFQPLVPEVSNVMAQLASQTDATQLNTVLVALQGTTETTDFFKQHIASHLMPVLVQIAKSHGDEAARKYAFEVIISFMESKPKMMIKVPNYIEQALDLCVHFMMELGDDVQSWMQQDEEDDEEEFFNVGKEAVDRISRNAVKVDAFPFLLEGLKQAVTKLFQSGEWKQVVAGISTLSMIAEYVDDEATVMQMVGGIKLQLAATNARVRFAAWSAVAQFSEDHAEVLCSEGWSSQLLPEFLKGLEDPCPRVSLRCMEAFQHYGESVEREDLEPYVQPLMEKLGSKLSSSEVKVQKKAITFIAVIAGQVDDAFAPYYSHLMPILKQVIANTLHKTEERQLLGKCFECISLLARAVGRTGFRADAEQIMQAMIEATKVPNLPHNDPVKEYMMAASERICATLKEDFLPFVSHILPGVLEKFTLAPREFTSASDELGDDDEVNLTLLRENGQVKVMVMYSSEIQDLKGALECVHTFVEELAAAYAPYVFQTAQALLPVFDFGMEDGIRDLAFETWGQLCRSAREGSQVQTVRDLVVEFLKRVLPKFEATKLDQQELKTSAEGVTSCLKEAGKGILQAEELRHICRSTLAVLAESFKRREAALAAPNGPKDEDDPLEDDDEIEEQAMRIALCEVAGPLMQHHPEIFMAESFPDYLSLVVQWLQPQAPKEDRKLALFVTCDFLEHLGTRASAHWPKVLPQMIEDIHNPDPELRQPACYGVFLAAKVADFAPLALDAAKRLAEVVTQSRQRSTKRSEKVAQACADNALSALVEILLTHHAAVASLQAELWKVWLQGLPCQQDESEGERNHRRLLELLQQEKPEVLGEGGQNVPKLFGVLVDVYKTDMADEETSKGIGLFALRLGESKLEAFASQFSEKQKKKLVRIVREAQSGQK